MHPWLWAELLRFAEVQPMRYAGCMIHDVCPDVRAESLDEPKPAPTLDPTLAKLKENLWREVSDIDQALVDGRLDEAGWHRAMAALVSPAYLTAATPFGQAGHSGDAHSWQESRGFVAHAIDRSGSFLDVGCASGVMMESARRWGAEKGLGVEPYGLEIVPELAELARRRLPDWSGRIQVGNIRSWRPAERFDYVLLRPEYAPPGKLCQLLAHVLQHVCSVRGRVIVLVGTEESTRREVEDTVAACGFTVAGRAELPHPKDDRVVRRLFWVDGEER
jgi:SAM-dependent methyltransferase